MNTTAHPAAYLRRSYVDPESPGDISREVQRTAVRKLAAADGHNGNLVEYDDWGISADVAKAGRRIAYTRLLADMEAGKVTAVYAFDVDRLYRDPRDLIRLQDAAQAHQVRIVTTGGPLAIGDGDDPAAEGFAFMGAVFGRMELQKIKKRNRAARDARIARGDNMGRPPYGYQHGRDADGRVVFVSNPRQPLEPVLDAFREAGSFAGAAQLLNRRNVPSPRGKRWTGNVVNRIIRREAPSLAPRGRVSERVAVRGSQRFSRLLRCPCGNILTPRVYTTRSKYGTFGPYVGYQCHAGRDDPGHQRPYMLNEPSLLEWAKAEAARLQFPAAGATLSAADHEDRRQAITERLTKYAELYAEGGPNGITRERYNTEKERAERELDELEQSEILLTTIPSAIDWSKEPASVNEVLRSMWRYVQLDADLRPVAAEWVRPEWRRP